MKIIDIAIAVIRRDNNILIALRPAGTHLGNLWEFPGGKVEKGESPEDAAIREVMEECGITISILEKWLPIEHLYTEKTIRLHPFLCMVTNGIPASLGSMEIRWVPVAELNQYAFPAANKAILDRLIGPVLK